MPQSPVTERRVVRISVQDLQFDPENPRLPRSIDRSDETEVIRWMLQDATLTDLMMSIAEQGYFDGEPVLVVKAASGKYIVVEGNRRLAAVKLLLDPSSAPVRARAVADIVANAPHRPEAIPAIVCESRDAVLSYLGYRHITGVKQWEPLEKARYLLQLFERVAITDTKERLQKVAKQIGSRTDYVSRLLSGLLVYEFAEDKGFWKLPISEDTIDFSVLTTALNYADIARFVGLNERGSLNMDSLHEGQVRDLFLWLFVRDQASGATKLGESRQLSRLARVVIHPDALARFRSGVALNEAVQLTVDRQEAFANSLTNANQWIKICRDLEPSIEPNEGLVTACETLNQTARSLFHALKGRAELSRAE